MEKSSSTRKDAAYWIQKLTLEPHPEGGYFRQTYRSDAILAREALPAHFTGPRSSSTAIYFLLDGDNFSAFHRLRSDEIWHFYAGSPLSVHVIRPDGEYSELELGNNPEAGEALQALVKAGCWFASEVRKEVREKDSNAFALVGCTVAPGFDFDDFELAERGALARDYPQHRKLIERLTRS